ncbi:uncharacterized protein E0L32_006437 [Thyridium curvatum]|uniref:Uncharacterized protein n=1 Tax=Thyridium curvatum TaxID=1093900 RepID=A0A507B0I3_9PEZI|nr:uncharacterized protein E0L32_006437 [Thyridium curvatum]TPX13237.1 hypothetical protein E0L32_006437 [Thyridium curvatum]
MSRPYDDDDDDRPRSRDHHRRQRSPDYYYAGGAPPPPYASGAMPAPPPGVSRARLQYEPQSPFYNPGASNPDLDRYGGLQVPSSRHRPRSVPPPMSGALTTRSRRGSRSPSPSRDHDHPHSPLDKARHALNHTFTPSTSGLGVGVLGAIVGGLAAREVSEATARNKEKSAPQHGSGAKDEDRDRARLVSTLIGAAVGGLGANALEKRLEKGRKEDREEQEAWERKWGRRGRDDRDDYEDDRSRKDLGRGGRKPRYDDRYGDDDDDGYDHVYRETQPRHRRSDDGLRGRY